MGAPTQLPLTNDPIIIGCDWSKSLFYGAVKYDIASSTNASPIVLTTVLPHAVTTSNYVKVANHASNPAANGTWAVTAVGNNTITLTSTTGNGVGGRVGQVVKLQSGSGYALTCELKALAGQTVIVSPTVTWVDQSKFNFTISLTDTQTTALSAYSGQDLFLVVKSTVGSTQGTLFVAVVKVKSI